MLNFNDSLSDDVGRPDRVDEHEGGRAAARSTRTHDAHVDDGRTNPDLLGLSGPFLFVARTEQHARRGRAASSRAPGLMREKLRDWQSSLNAPEGRSSTSSTSCHRPTRNQSRAGDEARHRGVLFGLGAVLGIAYLRHRTRERRRARAVTQPAAAGPPRSGSRPDRRLRWRPPFPGRAANEGDAAPVVAPLVPKKTEPALIPMTLPKKSEPDPVPTSPKRNGMAPGHDAQKKTEPVPVSASPKKKAEPAPVPTSEGKNGTAPVPTARKKTEPALIRRSMKKKAELAVVPPVRPARPAVRRPATSPHDPGPAVQNSQRVLVPVPVKRNGRSRNP